MGANVSLEQPWPGEALATVMTLTTLRVRANVHRVSGHRDVELVAVRTLASLLVGHTAMYLAVAGEIRGRAVVLATIGTSVSRLARVPGLGRRCHVH